MKTTNIILLCLALSTTSLAQEKTSSSRTKLQIGIKGGVNYSNVYDAKDETFKTDPKFGLALGVFAAIPIGKYIGVQPEVMFAQRGFKATGVLLGSSYALTRTSSYIDVPLLLAIKPIDNLTLLIGPQYSFLLKQKDELAFSETSVEQEETFANDNIRKNTLCVTGGLDLNLSRFVISARAGWDVQNNNGDGTSTTPRYKNSWYQLTLGIRF
jgi:hypothetical protein